MCYTHLQCNYISVWLTRKVFFLFHHRGHNSYCNIHPNISYIWSKKCHHTMTIFFLDIYYCFKQLITIIILTFKVKEIWQSVWKHWPRTSSHRIPYSLLWISCPSLMRFWCTCSNKYSCFCSFYRLRVHSWKRYQSNLISYIQWLGTGDGCYVTHQWFMFCSLSTI